ncbi:MAG: Eco57I restriction-modification methylase domain-containing protein [Promethearchaeota archaeon]
MKNQGSKNTIVLLNNFISDYEKKIKEKDSSNNIGVVFTPKKIADFIICNIFRIHLKELFNIQINANLELFFKELSEILSNNPKLRKTFSEKIKKIKVLDPSCGSGRFLESAANFLLKIFQVIYPNVPKFDLKNQIIQNNIYGIDIDAASCDISRLKLFTWLYSNETKHLKNYKDTFKNIELEEIHPLFKKFCLNFNIYNTDFLLEFEQKEGMEFDIIVGNPPYVENKKLKDLDYKKRLYEKFKSAYKLFDLSIIFIEKSLNILKKKGYLSFILPNKFLSADYGIKIRELLINRAEFKEIVNISSLPIFQRAATYPIIISLKKGRANDNHDIKIRKFDELEDLIKYNSSKIIRFSQHLINELPSKVIPISGNIDLIKYLYVNYKSMSDSLKNLKIIYRPFGFLKYSKYFDNISEQSQSDKDLLLIGTGNVGKYHIKFNKRIKIAKKDFKISYFNYNKNFERIWRDLSSEKIIFREIAKDLTCVYDPGLFINVTGLYFIKIPSFNTDELFCLLTILNSKLMDSVFKALFSSLHMSGGYLRFNGSFLKRLPMPDQFPISLSYLGKIIQFLSQLKCEMLTSSELKIFKETNTTNIKIHLDLFKNLANSLVFLLYLKESNNIWNKSYNLLYDILYSKNYFPNIQFKYLEPRFNPPNFKCFSFEKLKSEFLQISNCYKDIKEQINIDNIMKLSTSSF